MRLLLFIFSLGFANLNYSQSAAIDKLILQLDNSQFIIDHTEKSGFSMKSSAATKLIRKGKKASRQLVAALDDHNKNIMAHLVLCHIYFKHASFAGPKIVSAGDHNVYKYFLGKEHGEGLIISEIKHSGKYKIYTEPDDLKKVKEMWRKLTGK